MTVLNHDAFGPDIVVSPPTFVTDRVSVMTDFDILQIETDPNRFEITRSWPGIVWDLILTSRCVFECDPGMAVKQKNTSIVEVDSHEQLEQRGRHIAFSFPLE